MGKIGIVTIYSDNFGACLQAYALQYTLKKLGYDFETIQYSRNPQHIATESRWKKIFRYSPRVVINMFMTRQYVDARKKAYNEFRGKYLNFSNEHYYRDSDFSDIADRYDALICGSDMLWAEVFFNDWPFHYLSFSPKSKNIAFSPSFDSNKLSNQALDVCRNYINNIGHLACREEKGVDFIKEAFGLKATHTLDPTLLLTAKEWAEALLKGKDRLVEKKYILNYTFHGAESKGRGKIYSQLDKFSDYTYVMLSGAEGKYLKYASPGNIGPIEFVQLYRDAAFVVTDTFHGMLFAIIFNKPFIVLEKESFGAPSDRLTSYLATLGLSDRYVKTDVKINDSLFHIDYSKANQVLQQKIEDSISYLESSISDVLNNGKSE